MSPTRMTTLAGLVCLCVLGVEGVGVGCVCVCGGGGVKSHFTILLQKLLLRDKLVRLL